MGRIIDEINVVDVEKRKVPSKHYVYIIYVTWSDSSTNAIYRRYSRFFDFQSQLMDMFPEEAGALDPQKRIIPFLPGKKFFGRSHIREVAIKRMAPIAEYCTSILKLPRKISQCKDVLQFFELEPEDINPPKGRKASMKAKKISKPKPLEVYIAVTEYKKQEKGEVTLQVGTLVEVVEKTETGWWFVNVEEEQGWVPSTCLEREDGVKEDSSIRLPPGEEEQYLCTEEFQAQGQDELSLERGAVVDVIEKNLEGWWLVRYGGKEGYVPATFLIKTESFHILKKNKKKPREQRVNSGGPQIVKSLHEVSDLLKDDTPSKLTSSLPAVTMTTVADQDDVFDDDNYEPVDMEDEKYSIQELSKILKENKKGHAETEKVYESIRNMKSRSLKRNGSTRPPPRPSVRPDHGGISPGMKSPGKPVLRPAQSVSKEYITIAPFSDVVGDGISFDAGQQVKVLEKSENGWWYIEINEQQGWAPATYIEQTGLVPSTPKPPSPTPVQSSSPDAECADAEPSRRLSAAETIGGLANALKAKLQQKANKTPPTPPKKDFLNDVEDKDSSNSTRTENTTITGASTEFKKNAFAEKLKPTPGGGFNSANKPALKKPANRNLQPPPPAPPVKATPTVPVTPGKPIPPAPPSKPISDNKHPPPAVGTKPNTALKPSLPVKTDTPKTDTPVKPPLKNKPSVADTPHTDGKVNVAGLAGALKAKFEAKDHDQTTVTQKVNRDSSPKPAVKPCITKKPVAGGTNIPVKPGLPSKPHTSSKPSWVKKTESDNINTSIADTGTGKVSDLASVLKAKFENRQNCDGNTSDDTKSDRDTKPVVKSLLKPAEKPGRPLSPPSPRKQSLPNALGGSPKRPVTAVGALGRGALSPARSPVLSDRRATSPVLPGVTKLDPGKYSSRPLPPSPKTTTVQEKSKFGSNLPLKPGLKPKLGGQTMAHRADSTDSSDSDSESAGASNIANVLKAKFGAGTKNEIQPRSTSPNKPAVSIKPKQKVSNQVISDVENNNTKTDKSSEGAFVAIADFAGFNDGELQLVTGQTVEIQETADGWSYVSSAGIEGWVPSSYLEKAQPTASQEPERHTQTGLLATKKKQTVYSACSDFTAENEGEITVMCGEEVEVIEQPDGGWWFVQIGNGEGWVPAAYLTQI